MAHPTLAVRHRSPPTYLFLPARVIPYKCHRGNINIACKRLCQAVDASINGRFSTSMCYSLYLSTDSPVDLRVYSTDLVRFQEAEDYEYKATSIIDLLGYPNRWFVGSKSGCSCTFRHLMSTEPGFGAPEDWYPEGQVDLDATQQLYDLILSLLASDHRLDCIDIWAGAQPKDIKTLPVSLDAVPRQAFRLFENYRFIFERWSYNRRAPT
jgi:hypothetical protein